MRRMWDYAQVDWRLAWMATIALLLLAVPCASVAQAQGGLEETEVDLVVMPNGKTINIREATYRSLNRMLKRVPAARPLIESEFARRCDPVAVAEADRAANIALATPPEAGTQGFAAAMTRATVERHRAREIAYCAAAERLRTRLEAETKVAEAEQEFLKRVDALMFYGMSRERAERAAANDHIYKAELDRLQNEAGKP